VIARVPVPAGVPSLSENHGVGSAIIRWVHGLCLNARNPDCRVGRKCRSGVGGIQAKQERLPYLASRGSGRTLRSLGTHRPGQSHGPGGPEDLESLADLESPADLEPPEDLETLVDLEVRRPGGPGGPGVPVWNTWTKSNSAVAHIGAYEHGTSYSGGGLQLIGTGLAIPAAKKPPPETKGALKEVPHPAHRCRKDTK